MYERSRHRTRGFAETVNGLALGSIAAQAGCAVSGAAQSALATSSDPQRERIESALIELVAEHGLRDASSAMIAARARLPEDEFSALFSDVQDCFSQVWEGFNTDFLQRTRAAYAAAGGWREGLRAAAWDYCRWLQEDELRARLFMTEPVFAGETVQASRDAVMAEFVDLLQLGCGGGADVRSAHAEAVLGSIWVRVAALVRTGRFDKLPAGVPQMMYLVVLPYLGPDAAQEELRRGPEDLARYERREI